MIPKTKLLEWIEDYCLGNLSHSETNDFEAEINRNSELKHEVEFEKVLQSAITETDVLNLRDKLSQVSKQEKDNRPFNLLDGFDDVQQISDALSPEELLKFYDSLPKAHIYQHELVANENLHEFFREQNSAPADDEMDSDEIEEITFETTGLDEAVLEKDIINLRETLGKVSASVRSQCSSEEIDAYLEGELSGYDLERFEHELAVNNYLKREVKLHADVEKAILEPDIMNLRSELERLTRSETSWNVSEQMIEEYINGELQGEALSVFLKELYENSDLKAEVSLRQSVDKSIAEDDIFKLRSKLQQVKIDIEGKEVRSLVPDTDINHFSWWKAGVAIAVILLAFAGILSQSPGFDSRMSEDLFIAPQWAPQRSVGADIEALYLANEYFRNGAYEKALESYNQAIREKEDKFVFQFYKASILQNLGKHDEAIPEYTNVIAHGDNIFVEEAEWYRALCYLKLGEKEKAKQQLVSIINRKSYYANDAKAVLRKTRYSLR